VFVALVFVLLAQPKDFFQHFRVEAFAFGLGQNLLLPLIQRLYLFVDGWTRSIKERMRSPAIPTVSVMCRLSLMRTYGMTEKVTERLRGQ
jgi:hypothetical protein